MEYPGNSFKDRSTLDQPRKEKDKDKHVSAALHTGRVHKRTAVDNFKSTMFSESTSRVKEHIVMEIFIPTLKKVIRDIVIDSVEMALFGDTNRRDRRDRGNRPSYRDYYEDRESERERPSRRIYSYDDVVLDTLEDAEDILDEMAAIIDAYKFVSVADLYELVHLEPRYTDNRYGWKNLSTAEPIRVRDGYMLKLPHPKPLD